MKKIAITGIKKLEIFDVDKPKIVKDDDVLLKINSVGICGSDIHYYKEGNIGDQIIEFPFTIGHECSAIIEKTGVKVKGLKEGDLVAIEPALSCHECSQCLSGREHTCLNQKFLGAPGQADGCLSEYIILPAQNCFKVPGNITGEEAALIEPLSIGYYAAQFLKNSNTKITIAILGVGPIGLSVMLSLQAFGFKNIYVTDKLDYRINAAKENGAIHSGNPDTENIVSRFAGANPNLFDAVFECCGKQEALDQAVNLLRPGGKLFIVGIPEIGRVSFDISKIRRKEIYIQNVRRQNKSIQHCIDLSASRNWKPDFLITHRFPFEKTCEAFEIVANFRDGVIKAMIKFQ